ncbi:hypothetical protein HOB85_04980 [Candidatus Woesearchaeota archaeon]|nr:hypothetical protein [Candidatus Woesearchaeota archaeon]
MEQGYDLRRSEEFSLDDSLSSVPLGGATSLNDYSDRKAAEVARYSEAGKLGAQLDAGQKGMLEYRAAAARSAVDSKGSIDSRLREVVGLQTDMDIFYAGIEARLTEETSPRFSSLQDAEDHVTKTYLMRESAKYAGNKSEIARKNGLDRKTVERNLDKYDIDAKLFDPVAINRADGDERDALLYARDEVLREVSEAVMPYDSESVRKVVSSELDALRERIPTLYDQLKPKVEGKLDEITATVNQDPYFAGQSPNSMFLEALYKPTLKEAQQWVRGKVTEDALERNNGNFGRTAEELDVSEKTVRRVAKQHQTTLAEMQDVYAMYVVQGRPSVEQVRSDEGFVRDLHATVRAETVAPSFVDIKPADDGRTWQVVNKRAA